MNKKTDTLTNTINTIQKFFEDLTSDIKAVYNQAVEEQRRREAESNQQDN